VISTRGFVGGMSQLLHEMHIPFKVVIPTRGFVGGMSNLLHEIAFLKYILIRGL